MQFGKIDKLILFGGSNLLAKFSKIIKEQGKYDLVIYSCDRQLKEIVSPKGSCLEDILRKNNIEFYSTNDINKESAIFDQVTSKTIGLGFGEAWKFSKELIDLFKNRLLDIMGICLPQYRGGAHYTWQILRENKTGGCNLQIINEDTEQGKFDSGEIVKTKKYFFPSTVRIPEDYFNAAVDEEVKFLMEFLNEIENKEEFKAIDIQEEFSIYFPRLFTLKNAYINWHWDTKDIDKFICAFDSPYPGASTFYNGERLFFKKSRVELDDGPFHPFQAGLIFRIFNNSVYIATNSGTLIVSSIEDEKGINRIKDVGIGGRFYTPGKILEESLTQKIDYNASGLID